MGHYTAVGALVALTCFGATARAESPAITLRLASIAPEGSPWIEAAEAFDRHVIKASKGAVRLRVFHGGMLGDENQIMASAAAGKIDLYGGTIASTFDQVPELSALELPFLFRSEREVDRVVERLWPTLCKVVARRGYRIALLTAVGFRHMGTRRPIDSMADLRALRMRSQPTPIHERMWNLLGVKHRPLGVPDVIEAMERNQIDGFDTPTVWMFASAWHLHIKYLTLTRHIYQAAVILASPAGLARIPPALRERIFAGAERIGPENTRKVRAVEKQLLDSLPGLGVAVRPPSPELEAELNRAFVPVRSAWLETATPSGKSLLEAIERELAALRRG